ncbi:Uncharacterised protein [Mycobacteroides abscessus subsp. bolletii]|uniref:hypothetical protein n=1 Tax=Mycobacteroides abscessus TaxID=36809 RepID=UPI0009D35336|nr:hypothetical protein [Mycobacteroides abscessus]SLI42490.1 Uncharacterised protein [Mycobacteroides abscessus subsp. bolletii]
MGEWKDSGHLRLDSLLDASNWDALECEARQLRGEAIESRNEKSVVFRDGSFRSRSRFAVRGGGPVFQSILRSREVLLAVREATKLPRLIPVRCGYNYYRSGDFMGPHRDDVKASVTLTLGLTDNLGTMNWAPSLRHASNEDALALVDDNIIFPSNFNDGIEIGYRAVNAFDGFNIPHWRLPFGPALGILGTFCYFDL